MTTPHDPSHDSPAVGSARLTPMRGRDPRQVHRAATPLELLFDLTFVIGFGQASAQFAHAIAAGHLAAGLAAFVLAMFGICWAWVNFSWFSSAYDTDDWAFRLATMVQMVGVIVLSLGVPRAFASIEHGGPLAIDVMVYGYAIMRLPMVFLWLRAAGADPAHRRTCLTYAATIFVAQLGWVAMAMARPSFGNFLLFGAPLFAVELLGPPIAETHVGDGGTPWHAHHMAERYGLLAIIALGEEVVGTVATVAAIVQHQGWSAEAIMICAAGVGLTFGMWWLYFLVPAGAVLQRFRNRAFAWAYLHIPLFASIAATGAGLHVAGLFIEGKASIGAVGAVAAVATPVAAFITLVAIVYLSLFRTAGRLRLLPVFLGAAALAAAVGLAAAGFGLAICLAIVTIAPAVAVIGHEATGNRDIGESLAAELRGG